MSTPGKAIRQAREDAGLTLRELAAKMTELGHSITFSALAQKERGGIKVTPQDRKFVAKAVGESIEKFDARWRGSRIDQSTGEEDGIPVINQAPAGMVIDYTEYGTDSGQGFKYIDRGQIDDEFAFAVIVVGDSMEPSLFAGDYVIFSPLNVPRPRAVLDRGKTVFVRFGPVAKSHGCCIARYGGMVETKLVFTKDNPGRKGFTVPPEDIEQLSVAVERRTARI